MQCAVCSVEFGVELESGVPFFCSTRTHRAAFPRDLALPYFIYSKHASPSKHTSPGKGIGIRMPSLYPFSGPLLPRTFTFHNRPSSIGDAPERTRCLRRAGVSLIMDSHCAEYVRAGFLANSQRPRAHSQQRGSGFWREMACSQCRNGY